VNTPTLRILAAAAASLALPLAALAQESFVVIKASKVITGAGEEIDNGEVVIVDGKVRLVGKSLEYPATATIINAPQETVIPGLVHARARPGLPEYQRSGVRGNFRASSDIFPGALDFKPFLENGFTSVAIVPPGVQVPGLASVYHTAGAAQGSEAAPQLLDVPGYVRVTMNSQPRDKGTLRDVFKKAHAEIEKVDKARADWEAKKKEADAKKAADAAKPAEPPKDAPKPEQPAPPGPPAPPAPPSPQPAPQGPPAPAPNAEPGEFKPPEMDATHRPFIDLLQKKAGAPALFLELAKSADYVHLADVLDDEKDRDLFKRWLYLAGTPGFSDFNFVVTKLGDAKANVALSPLMHRMPNTLTRYNLAGELIAAGCDVAFIPPGDTPADLASYRPRVADMARAGIERAAAIKALTINPARILGADKQLGSIEKGKNADIVFLDADILDPLARVTRVMINGEIVWKKEEATR
jgi:hypothetical protein